MCPAGAGAGGAGRDAGRTGGDGAASRLSHGPCPLQPWDRTCPDPPSGALPCHHVSQHTHYWRFLLCCRTDWHSQAALCLKTRHLYTLEAENRELKSLIGTASEKQGKKCYLENMSACLMAGHSQFQSSAQPFPHSGPGSASSSPLCYKPRWENLCSSGTPVSKGLLTEAKKRKKDGI